MTDAEKTVGTYQGNIMFIKYHDRRNAVDGGDSMGGPSERQLKERLNSIKERTGRREKDVQKDFTKIEKMKVDALKKAEDMRQTAYKDINKIEKNVIQSKDLAPESKDRLRIEIAQIRDEIEDKHARLRTKISETMIPAVTEQVQY